MTTYNNPSQRWYYKCLELGLCTQCGKPNDSDTRQCLRCCEVNARRLRERRQRRIDNKQCPSCGDCVAGSNKIMCEKCLKHGREYLNSKKGKRKEYFEKSYNKLKDEVFAAYGGRMCVCCGETIREFLTIDHINNDGAKHRKEINTPLYTWLRKNNYPEGFQVLCWNCNSGKRINGGVCPHKGQ